MRLITLLLIPLFLAGFSLTTWLEPRLQTWAGNRAKSADILEVALGDSRKLFAKHFYVKADAYFHNGYYPTIYDNSTNYQKQHITEEIGLKKDDDDEAAESFLGKPRDWIDRFSRNFFPARHTHLGDAGCGHSCCQRPKGEPHTHDHPPEQPSAPGGQERELLPWLRLSAELDPQRVETYVVSAYWLRSRLNKVNEAEQILREGLQANPGNYEILFELGRIQYENRKDIVRARNLWELALTQWRAQESGKPEPNIFLYAQILGQLAKLEEEQKNFTKAIDHLTQLKGVSPNKASIQNWIEDLQKKQAR